MKNLHIETGDTLELTADEVPWKMETPDLVIHVNAPKLFCYTVKPERGFRTFWEWLSSKLGGSRTYG